MTQGIFGNNVPVTLGVDIVQTQLAELFNMGYYYDVILTPSINPFEEATTPKYTLGSVKHYILNFISPTEKNFKDQLDPLGFDDERFYQILIPYGINTVAGDQFLLFVNGFELRMIVVDYKEDLSGLRNLSCKHLKEFLLD